jgi:hypothetical protein
VDLHIHSPIRLHGAVLNYLSTGTTLPLSFNFKEITQVKRGRVHLRGRGHCDLRMLTVVLMGVLRGKGDAEGSVST